MSSIRHFFYTSWVNCGYWPTDQGQENLTAGNSRCSMAGGRKESFPFSVQSWGPKCSPQPSVELQQLPLHSRHCSHGLAWTAKAAWITQVKYICIRNIKKETHRGEFREPSFSHTKQVPWEEKTVKIVLQNSFAIRAAAPSTICYHHVSSLKNK